MYPIPHAQQRAYERFGLSKDDLIKIGQMIENDNCYQLNSYDGRTSYLVNYGGKDLTVVVSNRRQVIITVTPFTVHKVFERI